MRTTSLLAVAGMAVIAPIFAPARAPAATAAEHGATIEVWVRKPAGRDRLQVVNIDALPLADEHEAAIRLSALATLDLATVVVDRLVSEP